MHEKSNQVVLELKKTGLRVLNDVELLSVGSGQVNTRDGHDTATGPGTIDTGEVTSVSTRNGSGG